MPELISSFENRKKDDFTTKTKKGCFNIDDIDKNILTEYESVSENMLMKVDSETFLRLFRYDKNNDIYDAQISKNIQSLGNNFKNLFMKKMYCAW